SAKSVASESNAVKVKKPEAPTKKKVETVDAPVTTGSSKVLKKVKMTEPEFKTPIISRPPEAEKVPESTPAPQPAEGASRYRKIKVVAESSGDKPEYGLVSKPQPNQEPVASIGRKEVIEIRDFNRLNKAAIRKKKGPGRKGAFPGKKTEITTPKAQKRIIRISDGVTVAELAKKMSVKVGDVIARLMGMGMVVTINQTIDVDTATLVSSEFGFEIENVYVAPEDLIHEEEKAQESKPEDLKTRPPVVTVMGHVDHGKTTLLDRIRKTDVVSGEAGGITQHIGAYTVKTESGKYVTFVDTPGHEAFTAMRARGAQVTDIVILVVAADDGVMPQTKEAINHAKNANVPIIVAVNKMDKPGANLEKIKKTLTEFSMVPEEWGGDTIYVPVSAKSGDGVPQLLEFALLQAEVLDLKANPDRQARGVVLEASLDKQRGIATTIIVQEGTLREGDIVVAGMHYGKIRAMRDDKGSKIREAGPSRAVEIMGLSGVANAADKFIVVNEEKRAKQITELKQNQVRQQELAKSSKVSLDDLYQKIESGDVKELKIIVKADTIGSVEVLSSTLQDLSTAKVSVKVIHGAVGGISENDVMLATASGALIVAFHLRPDASVRKIAEQHGVEIRTYDIIYELTEDMTKAMEGLLQPTKVEKVIGHAEIREVFSVPKVGAVAGCYVTSGKINRASEVRLIRDSVPIYTGNLKSLKRFKDDVREVTEGLECGMGIENFNDIKVGDIIEAFEVKEVQTSIN
ncbi:MAG: translation initiation factor IF-2, partial [Bdellovibrionales bacterium]|nr:translation initiation factor IF-2 [Bdellovibrionales bacterium]